jgi:hypothetical protein
VGNSATPIAEQEAIIAALRVRHENAEHLRVALEERLEAIMALPDALLEQAFSRSL